MPRLQTTRRALSALVVLATLFGTPAARGAEPLPAPPRSSAPS